MHSKVLNHQSIHRIIQQTQLLGTDDLLWSQATRHGNSRSDPKVLSSALQESEPPFPRDNVRPQNRHRLESERQLGARHFADDVPSDDGFSELDEVDFQTTVGGAASKTYPDEAPDDFSEFNNDADVLAFAEDCEISQRTASRDRNSREVLTETSGNVDHALRQRQSVDRPNASGVQNIIRR